MSGPLGSGGGVPPGPDQSHSPDLRFPPEPSSGRRRHWWSAQPAPTLPPITAKRALAEVLLVFGAFFGAGILAAGFSLGSSLPANNGGWGLFVPNAFDELAQAGTAAALVVLLLRNRGVSLRAYGLDVPRLANGRMDGGQVVRIMTWALVAFIAGSLVTSALATGNYNTPQVLNAPFLTYAATASVNAGVIEEMVVLGFVVVTLRQARLPLWQVVAVALVLRASYHIYYGPGVVGILVWASVFIWLYLRFRSLVPIIVVHFLWDLTVFMGDRWTIVADWAVVAVVGLVIAAPITWLVDRNKRKHQPAAPPLWSGSWASGTAPGSPSGGGAGSPLPPASWDPGPPWLQPGPSALRSWDHPTVPGWRPDPWGQAYWRWWDGHRWTDAIA